MPWWERWPGRLSREVSRLREQGFLTTFDDKGALSSPIVIDATYSLAGIAYELRIIFPDLYPYFRPEVYAPNLAVDHHQNPIGKNLCLLGRNSDNWDTNYLVADVIAQQLPKLLGSEDIAKSGGRPEEELQAEPWVEYLEPDPRYRILWNSNISVPRGSVGKLQLTYKPDDEIFRAYVSRVNRNGTLLFQEETPPFPEAKTQLWIPFACLNEQPPPINQLAGVLQRDLPNFNPHGSVNRLSRHTRGTLLALFYPEETGYRSAGIGLTVALFEPHGKKSEVSAKYLKTFRAGEDYALSRLGRYGSLRTLRVALVGFGNIGSAVAATLCKLGVKELTLIDRDQFDPGNTARHFLGMQFAGADKVDAGARALRRAYPYTTVEPFSYRLGDIGPPGKGDEFVRLLVASDTIIDCTAERAVQHFLSTESWERNKPYLFVEGYPGMLGGFVGLIKPGLAPCYLCFLAGRVDGSIGLPPVPQDATIQPAGCGEPTFAGTPFDSDTISAAAVRMLFGSMSDKGNYPHTPTPSSYARIALADDPCAESTMRIEPIAVKSRPACPFCGSK